MDCIPHNGFKKFIKGNLDLNAVLNMSNVSPVFSVEFLSLEWGPLLDQSLKTGMSLRGKAGSCFLNWSALCSTEP